MLAYATGDAFAEVLVPCPWYVLELAKKVLEEREQWKPMARHDFKDKMGRCAGVVLGQGRAQGSRA